LNTIIPLFLYLSSINEYMGYWDNVNIFIQSIAVVIKVDRGVGDKERVEGQVEYIWRYIIFLNLEIVFLD